MKPVRDRIRRFCRVPARELKPHPRNWRTHPDSQREALAGVLREIGYADALMARQRDDGALELIDGHLRAETTPDQEVPVLIVDLTDDEAEKLLAVFDPLGAEAQTDAAVLSELLARIETQEPAVGALLEKLREQAPLPSVGDEPPEVDVAIPELYQVVVDCEDETHQRTTFEMLQKEGYRCRLLML